MGHETSEVPQKEQLIHVLEQLVIRLKKDSVSIVSVECNIHNGSEEGIPDGLWRTYKTNGKKDFKLDLSPYDSDTDETLE